MRASILVGALAGLAAAGLAAEAGAEAQTAAPAPRAADPAFVKGPYLQSLTPAAVDIVVEVDPPSPVELTVATDRAADGGDREPSAPLRLEQPAVHDFHRFHVTGLAPSRAYTYVVRAGESRATSHFRTPPDPASSVPSSFSFLVYGDSRTDDAAHAALVARLVGMPSDFLIGTGDLVEDGASAGDWRTFFSIEGTLLRDRCLYACVGNHELAERSGANFLAYFAPGDLGCGGPGRACESVNELYGTFRWANTRFFLLNGMDAFATGMEREWLGSELARADAEPGLVFRVVVVHHGPFSSGPHGDNPRLHAAGIPAMLRAHHVDLVLSGHDHLYERGTDDGLKYLVSGGGGAPLYRDIHPRRSTRKVEAVHHVVRFAVDDRAMTLVTTRADGSVLESCGFSKPDLEVGDWSCDRAAAGDEAASTVAVATSAQPGGPSPRPSRPSRACGCTVVGADRSSRGVPLGSTMALVVLGAFRFFARRRRQLS